MTKLMSVARRNSLGLTTPEKKVMFAALQLWGATTPSPTSTILIPAVPAVPAKAAIVGTGTVANPQFPAVAAKAAIPAKTSPIVAANPTWINSVAIDDTNASYTKIVARLPYSPAAIAKGATLGVAQIQPMTTIDLGEWIGDLSNVTATTDTEYLVNGVAGTLEQYLYENAQSLTPVAGTTNIVESGLYQPVNPALPKVPCIYIEVYVAPDNGSN
jgi:hypothetical protein